MNSRPTSINVPFGNVGNESGQRFAVLMKRIRFMRAKPHFGLPQSRYRSTTSLMIGRKKPRSFASRLRTAKPVLPLEPALILGQEPFEMMEQHPVEDGALRMSRTIDSRNSRRIASRNGPTSQIGPRLPFDYRELRAFCLTSRVKLEFGFVHAIYL